MDIYEMAEVKLEVINMNSSMITLVTKNSSQKLQLRGGTESATQWVKHISAVIDAAQKAEGA